MTTAIETGFRVIAKRAELADSLASLSGVVPSRIVKPVFACVHISAGERALALRTTNLAQAMQIEAAQVQVEQQGEVCVSCDKFAKIMRELTCETVTLALSGDVLEVHGDSQLFKLLTFNPKDFPPAPDFNDIEGATIPAETLARMIRETRFATDANKGDFSAGVNIAIGKKTFTIAATEHHVASEATIPLESAVEIAALVPVSAMILIERACEEGDATIQLTENQARFTVGGVTLTTTLLQATFPLLADFFPTDVNRFVTLGREELMTGIRQAAIVATEATDSMALAFEFSKKGLTIKSRSPENGEATINIPCKFKGDEITIGFQSRWFIELLRSSECDEVKISMAAPSRPAIVELGAGHRCLVMPIHLQGR